MSVVGFDFGSESCTVAVARQGVIDVVLNNESKRETPAVVCFGDKQRLIGTAGAASSAINPRNTISQIKRLIGRRFSDPEVQLDLQSLPFSVTEGPDGLPLINARYLGEMKSFTPTQIFAMILSDLKAIAERNLGVAVHDCCIGIPAYFTDLQRRAVLDAATIAELHPLRLFHETTATALAYGIYKTDLPEKGQLNVAFVDIGHSSMQVCIAAFRKGQLKVLSHAFDQSLGGRDFDEVLFKYFSTKIKQEHKIDVFQNARACIRLRAACEKLKKVLSANPEAPLNIECLMEEKDVRDFIKRKEFEDISMPILQRVNGPLEKALMDAGLGIDSIHAVEVVGSGSRVPVIIKILKDFFGKDPRRTMNASECVARGCALQCAMLSPTFKVRVFQVHECFPFPIVLSWKVVSPKLPNEGVENQTIVFPKGNTIPSAKVLTFFRSRTFTVDVVYADVNCRQAVARISTYMIGPFQSTKGEHAKLKVKVRLNLHGVVSIESATMLEEEVEVPVSSASKPLKHEELNDSSPVESDVNMQDIKNVPDVPGASAEFKAPDSEGTSKHKPVQMDTDVKAENTKRKVRKTNIPISELIYGGMSTAELHKAVEYECEMAVQDRVMEETKDKKNAVEAYVYDIRNKLHDKYQEFVEESERQAFSSKLQEVEDWLYEDGEDEAKEVYISKLEELKKQGDPIELRYKESYERKPAIDLLIYCIDSYRFAAMSDDLRFDHIDNAEKQKVVSECELARLWLNEKIQQQDALPKYANPVLLSTVMKRKVEVLDRFCRPIMTKPKPAPPKPQAPPPSQAGNPPPASPGGTPPEADSTAQQQSAASQENAEAGNTTSAATEPMDTDSSHTNVV